MGRTGWVHLEHISLRWFLTLALTTLVGPWLESLVQARN